LIYQAFQHVGREYRPADRPGADPADCGGHSPALDAPLHLTMSPFRALLRSIQQTMQKRRGVLRLYFQTVVPTALALVGSTLALSASTSASEVDLASDIQGSLVFLSAISARVPALPYFY
jgi:hypothetical protein